MKRIYSIIIIILAVGSMLLASPAPLPKIIYQENFDSGTYNTNYWSVVYGNLTANGTTPGAYNGDNPQYAFGKLSLGTQPYTEIGFDLYKLVVTDLGYPVSELANITFSYDIAQTNGTGGWYSMKNGFYNGYDVKPSQMLPTGDSSGLRGDEVDPQNTNGWTFAGLTSFSSLYGGASPDPMGPIHPGVENYHRLNRGQWEWQRMKHEFNVEEYVTMKLYQDYEMNGEYHYVASAENYHPSSGITPWPYPEGYSIMNRDGTVSWFIDNITVQLNNPYSDWNLVLEDNFDLGTIDSRWTTNGHWTVTGGSNPWGAMSGKMASAQPDAFFKTTFPAINPGELLALTFTVEQSNGTNGDFPIFFGFVDAQSSDYYVEYASPAITYGGSSGAMVMQNAASNGNGENPFEPLLIPGDPNPLPNPDVTESWWNFGAGIEGKRINSSGSTRVDMIINPWDNYPSGSVSVYFDRQLAAKWDNFRGIYSFNEIFFGIRKNIWDAGLNGGAGGYVPTWNFDNIKVYKRAAKCGDAGDFSQFDFNKDCVVDLADFAMFASEWMSCTRPDCLQ